jgi:hypothetical protein
MPKRHESLAEDASSALHVHRIRCGRERVEEEIMSKSETTTTDTGTAGEPRRRLTDKELDAVAGGFPGNQAASRWYAFLQQYSGGRPVPRAPDPE